METRYTIGEFAKIVRLSAKALRLYDELGLLRPARVDPWTGYRTYTVEQAPRARAIALLRSVDMPLATIAEVLAATDEDELRLLLARYRTTLEARLEEHRQKLLQVERLIQRGEVMGLDAQIKELPPTVLWAEQVTCQSDSEHIGAACGPAYDRLYGALAAANVTPVGAPWLRYLDMGGEEWTLEVGVPVWPGAGKPEGFHRTEVPATRVAAAIHRGPYNELGLSYNELTEWIERHGHRPAGQPIVDIYLNDPSKTEPQDLETEICIPVEAKV